MAQKKPRMILPVGIAVWPHLNEIEVYQPVDKKGKPNGAQKRHFITKVRYDSAQLSAIKAELKKHALKLGVGEDEIDSIKLPFKKIKVKDKEGNVTGHEFLLQATSGEKYRPPAFDAKNNKLPPSVTIGGGSKIRLDVTVNYYDGFGGGINLYMNAVQVIELVEGGQFQNNFGEEEGFEYGDEDGEGHSSFGDTTTSEEKPDPKTAYDF
jgi:hypothetical protein